ERLQTPVIVMSDLELGMNNWVTPKLDWDDSRVYDRGKVLSAEDLESMDFFGRYMDVDGDGIAYRTIPGVHPDKGSYFTRGSSHNAKGAYSESSVDYVENMNRLEKKFETAAKLIPAPVFDNTVDENLFGIIYFGTTSLVMDEALEQLREYSMNFDTMKIMAFPFSQEVYNFINGHLKVFVVEQNRDGQMRTLLINEGDIGPTKLISVPHYSGMPITATFVSETIVADLKLIPKVAS
ncbi:MAG: 2-oxoacid:acceptor oxidoreductase subunit alpha, partial [Gammaproteobacteria bacterium]